MNADAHLMMEAYKTIREQSPLLNNPMGAAMQGAVRGATPYAAGAIAGAKQLGQNMVGAVAGSAQAPQSPVAAAKQAFTQQQMNAAIDAVMKALNLPVTWRNYVAGQVQGIGNKVSGLETARDQYNVANAVQRTAQTVTPQTSIPPRIEPLATGKGFSQVKPGSVLGGQVPDSYALQNMRRAADNAQIRVR
jgi:hypothetical protein